MITLNKIPGGAFFIYSIIICYLITPLFSENLENKLPYIEEYQLDNGLRVLIAPNYDNPVVYINVYINASTLDDPVNHTNIAEDAFYSLDLGTSKYPSEDHIRDKLFSLGSDDGRFKRFHINYIHGTIQDYFLKKDLNEGLELISEILIHPTYPILLKKFLLSIVFHLSPKTSLIRNHNLLQSHSLHQYANIYKDILPKPTSGKKDLIKWHHNYFRPENITIMVSGDVNAIYVKKVIGKYFGDWESTEYIPEKRNYSINLNDNTGIKLRFINVESNKDALISIMQGAPRINDEWLYAGMLAHSIFGEQGFSSRLSNIHSKFNFYGKLNSSLKKHPTIPYVQVIGEAQYKELSHLYYEIQQEFNNLSNNSITKAELDRSKKIRLHDYNNRLHNPRRLSTFIQDNYNVNGYSLDEISNKWKYIQSVTLEEVNDAASIIFDADNLMMVVVGNKDSCAIFLEQFENVEYYEHAEELRESASSP